MLQSKLYKLSISTFLTISLNVCCAKVPIARSENLSNTTDHLKNEVSDTILSYFNKDEYVDKCIIKKSNDGRSLIFLFGDKSGNDVESFNCQFPELDTYDKVEISVLQEKHLIEISFRSTFSTYFNVYLHFSENSRAWKVSKGFLYNPVQWDFDSKVEECSVYFDVPIKTFGEKINKIQDKIFDDKSDCQYSYTISRSLDEIYNFYKAGEDLKERRSGVERIKAYLKKYPLSNNNLTKYNDMGFYMERDSLYLEASYLLSKVVEKFPTRTAAYINLGDSHWGLKNLPKAKEAYTKYIELMKKSGKETKIPQRILERVK